MASLSCIRAQLAGGGMTNVVVGDAGYRAISGKRRSLGVQHTPPNDVVPFVAFSHVRKPS